ncbi:hypothetical protein [Antrihabitans cavernicola]|uniref:YfhO family protein n=1 Tax=Antrihabitans cavernicola TaxID=2495913 RepID=A0A5A7SHH7_9NOCA|nr:hypothetical protein [Spelaeibacter cavernicola]KAA0024612.1 hypothetical protein FOY51_01265 [Spelaeibacter cavernicola]
MISTRHTSTRTQRWAWGAAVAAVVCIGFGALLLHDHRYFYLDDSESGAVGNWIQLGHILRSGHFPSLVLDQWMSGNYPVEGQGGLWNPVQMLINFIAPSVDDMALLAAGVKLFFSIVLGWGIFRVANEYGAHPAWAAVAGASAPFAGFTLYFEQTSWVTSLIGAAWVIQGWASGIRYARGKSGPIPMFVFLYLAISVGYVHAALMAGVVTACLMVGEGVYSGKWLPSLRVATVGAAAAAAGAITFLPGVLTSAVTWRTGADGVYNDNFLTAPWSETITASIPTSVTSIESWSGETTVAPITYIAWFAVPALAFVAWKSIGPAMRELTAPLAVLVCVLLFTAGPSDIGQIRWPARVLPFVALAALILIAVVVSRFGTLRPLKPRLLAAGLIIVVLVLRAGSSGPQFMGRHLVAGLAMVAAGVVALYFAKRFGAAGIAGVLLISIVPVALYQVSTYTPVLINWQLPQSQSAAKAGFPDYQGTTLQLGDRSLIRMGPHSREIPWQSQVYGNYAKDLNLSYANAYTPVGHQAFGTLLCMGFDGSTCKDAYKRAFTVDRYTGRTFVDLMQVDRVVLQKKQYPFADRKPAPLGWKWVTPPLEAGKFTYVLERVDGPVSGKGNRIATTVNAQATPISSDANHEHATVSSPTGGSVVFSRLAWPGYTATLNGKPLTTKGLGDTFLYVDLPPGTRDADLAITFRPPGQRIGLAGIAAGLVVVAALTVIDFRQRRRTRRTPESAPAPVPTEPIG